MNTFQYNITTSIGNATGSVQAKDEDAAVAQLRKQYAGQDIEIVSLDVNQVN